MVLVLLVSVKLMKVSDRIAMLLLSGGPQKRSQISDSRSAKDAYQLADSAHLRIKGLQTSIILIVAGHHHCRPS